MDGDINVPVAPPPPKRARSFLGVGLALLLAVATFFSGIHLGTLRAKDIDLEAGIFSIFSPATAPAEGVELDEFWRVWNLMEEKYVSASSTDDVSSEERIHGAIQGMVSSYGDPYTVFLPPVDAEKFDQDISGNFGGVGMEVGIRNGVITVIAPLPDTPAEAAGLVPSDVIVEIDGVSTENMTIDDAVSRIRGEKGTEVVLKIYREGEVEFLEISVIRDTIQIPTVKTEERDGVFIISLYSFNAIAEAKVQEALREFAQSDTRKLVFDLRGNPGGFLQSAVSIASYFLPAGEVVVRENFSDGTEEEVYRSSGKQISGAAPEEMVVLINGGSASASEILAGALSQHHVATLMGDTSFGKGSVQELVDLPEGSSLKVTIARWFTPDGTSISDGGLDPDIFVERTPQQIMAQEDPQLEAAIAWLNGDKTVGSTTKEVPEETDSEE